MNARSLTVSLLLLSLFAGCRQNQRMQFYIDNLNAEKRVLEDQLNELQYDYDEKLSELEETRRQLGIQPDGRSSVLQPPRPTADDSTDDGFPDVPSIQEPVIEFGDPEKADPGDSDQGPPNEVSPLEIDLGEGETGDASTATTPLDQTVTRLYLNPALSGGRDRDGKPGDDGIRLVIEPRNEQNEFVRQPGRITVVLLDPKQRTRVAKWEFDTEQTALALQRARRNSGIRLDLPWRGAPPEENRLHLFVRFWPSNGQAVQADREITITPPGQLTATWTPRSEDRMPTSINRISVAEKQGAVSSAEPVGSAGQQAVPEVENKKGGGSAKQAELPAWQPYR